jgi:hypothetical protein
MDDSTAPDPRRPRPASTPRKQRPWTAPAIRELPRLTDLTLQTGVPIPGTGGSGGSSVF